ncbi:hypothetical protein [Agromyces sp. NPDC057865]|uniref:hypothetical protein n=1 Tax=Agromyces sp. NPDC057865 TaxID=3346267 RepID=UPI0036717E2D
MKVRVDAAPRADDVVLSPEASLSADELAYLAGLPMEVQVRWLQENEGGNVSGTREVTLYLTGNRANTVRVTDVSSEESCEPISRGTLVRMTAGRGAGVDSEVMSIDVGEGASEAYAADPSGQHQAYFPDRTITLARGEEVPVVVDLIPAFNGSICRVELDLTVWDGSAERTLRISGPDGPFVVMSIERYEDEDEYGTVYLGGEVCRQYVPAPPDWSSNPPCGEGNFAY